MNARLLVFAILLILATPIVVAQDDYIQFEGRQTHPIKLSADGKRLYALNTPDARLSVFDVSNRDNPRPVLVAEIPVGLEPVSLAERSESEVWVVNELSDAVSIVSIPLRITTATLKTGDEPADIAFAGGRAFVTNAQERTLSVFDAESREQIAKISLHALFPRAIVADASGEKLYIAAQMSGNKTTILPAAQAPNPPAPTNPEVGPAPKTGLIVADSHEEVSYQVLDNDVAVVDIESLSVDRYLSNAGTTLFDLVLDPSGDDLWITNQEALNLTRFEPSLRGHFVDNRVTKIDVASGIAMPIDLNAGLDYSTLPNEAARLSSIAQPTAIVFDPGGEHLWIAGFGSDLIAKLDQMSGAVIDRIDVGPQLTPLETSRPEEKRGPRGLAIDPAGGRLFVLNRLTNTISVIDTASSSVLAEIPVGSHDPTPVAVRRGRGFLYDARLSGNGTNSCASCHIDGDRDGIAWDLGDPGGDMVYVTGENRVNHDTSGNDEPPEQVVRELHPMKGPKVTQTLRGMIIDPILVADPQHPDGVSTREPLFHWRGDRKGLDEFNATFDDLMGGAEIPQADFDDFKSFLRSMRLHPNPYRELDRGTPDEIEGGNPDRGRANFLNHGLSHCAVCHPSPSGTDQNIDEFNNSSTVDLIKTPPLMLSYQKQGIFSPNQATSLSGFGFGHDGTGRSLPLPHFYFLSTMDVPQLIDTRAFVLAFDSITAGTAPVVGHLMTVNSDNANSPEVADRLDTLQSRADPARAEFNQYWNDVVAHGIIGDQSITLRFDATTGGWLKNHTDATALSREELLGMLGSGDVLTFVGVPAGEGQRIGFDRNQDGIPDGDEVAPALSLMDQGAEIELSWDPDHGDWYPEVSGDLRRWETFTDPGRRERTDASRYYRLRKTW